MHNNPFLITVYDKAFNRRGWVGDPVSLEVHPRHNRLGTATFTLPADHSRVADLTADGARVVIDYHGSTLLSGPVRDLSGKGPKSIATTTFSIEDDFRLVYRVLGWPVPANAITAQGTGTGYYEASGAAETVVKGIISANASRLGLPVTVAASLGRGSNVSLKVRMTPLADTLLPLMDAAGIGLTVRQSGAGLLVDCYAPQTRAQVLSEDSGVVVDWSWSRKTPIATRVVVGGQGEGTARTFTAVVDSSRESTYGDVIEVFRDARDEATAANLPARGQETLDEGAPTTGLSLTLTETDSWRYGKAVNVGDLVTTQIAPGATVTDVLREVTLQWDRDSGLTVEPVVGERTDDPSRTLARAVGVLARGFRTLTNGR